METETNKVDFESIASREYSSLFNVRIAAELLDGSWPFSLWNSEFFTEFHRCVVYGQTDGNDAAFLFHCVACR